MQGSSDIVEKKRRKSVLSTEDLLSRVAERLYTVEQIQVIAENYPLRTVRSVPQTNFIEAFRKLNNENEIVSESSSLLAGVHFILRHSFPCSLAKPMIEDGAWPCATDYKGEILRYCYHMYAMDVCIMMENNPQSPNKFFYLLFSFPPTPQAYRIEIISSNLVPEPNEDVNNISKFDKLTKTVDNIMETFCYPYVALMKRGENYRRKDLSFHGVQPNFLPSNDNGDSPNKKRKLTTTDPPEYQPIVGSEPVSKIYLLVKELFDETLEYTQSSILFAVIYTIFVGRYACTGPFDRGKWPGTREYDSEVVQMQMRVPEEKIEKSEADLGNSSQTYLHTFNMSILRSPNAFFLNLRYLRDEVTCTQKIVPELVPSFKCDEIDLDNDRFEEIVLFCSDIYQRYICRVVKGQSTMIYSQTSSETSLVSTAADTPRSTESSSEESY